MADGTGRRPTRMDGAAFRRPAGVRGPGVLGERLAPWSLVVLPAGVVALTLLMLRG